ncbi:MAG: hypothetical protein H0U79_00900, partial [Solirubrobacterales bacterium]|nr:hypothetical protein [Solirubrobacterales bacterium]
MLADGRVLVTGGVLQTYTTGDARRGEGWKGLNRTFTSDPVTKQWQEHEQMRKGRYYPTQLLMADGRSVVVQGWDESGFQRDNLDLELFRPRQAARRGGRPARHRAGVGARRLLPAHVLDAQRPRAGGRPLPRGLLVHRPAGGPRGRRGARP